MADGLRIVVRVKPGSSRPVVGGTYGDGELIVAVAQRPVEGAANDAVVTAVARAFALATRDITLVAGAKARTKVLFLDGDVDELVRRRDLLLRTI